MIPRSFVLSLSLALLAAGAAAAGAAGAAGAADRPPAPDPALRLKTLEREIEQSTSRSERLAREADRIAAEVDKISRARVRAAAEAQAQERAITSLRRRVIELRKAEIAKTRGLAARRERLAELLAALARIARNPPEAVVAYTRSPQDTLRSAILLKAAVPPLEAQARALREDLGELARLRADAEAREKALKGAVASLAAKREELTSLLARKRDLEKTARAEHERAAALARALAAEAVSLKDLLGRITRERQARQAALLALPRPPDGGRRRLRLPLPPIAKARGRLSRPVTGEIRARFGDSEPSGTHVRGLRFAAAPGAQVVAPYGGEVVFAGVFRGYGRLLIIDHGEGYHTLLAGLGRIDATVNRRVLTGEPVGIMARRRTGRSGLYMEFRRNGQPIDPLPWLATPSTDKVSG